MSFKSQTTYKYGLCQQMNPRLKRPVSEKGTLD